MRVEHLRLRDGARASAVGRVVATAEGVTFEPPLPRALAGRAPGYEQPPQPTGLGVAVSRVDLDLLEDRRAQAGAVEGWARLSGVWHAGTLVVDTQEPALPTARATGKWREPPCPAPVAGWARGSAEENLDLRGLDNDESIVAIAQFRPGPDQVVLVVATTQPHSIEAKLRPQFGERLCVVASRWTKQQVDHVNTELRTNMQAWRLYIVGPIVTEDGQAQANADAVLVTDECAAWAERVPEGLLGLNPWLSRDPS